MSKLINSITGRLVLGKNVFNFIPFNFIWLREVQFIGSEEAQSLSLTIRYYVDLSCLGCYLHMVSKLVASLMGITAVIVSKYEFKIRAFICCNLVPHCG